MLFGVLSSFFFECQIGSYFVVGIGRASCSRGAWASRVRQDALWRVPFLRVAAVAVIFHPVDLFSHVAGVHAKLWASRCHHCFRVSRQVPDSAREGRHVASRLFQRRSLLLLLLDHSDARTLAPSAFCGYGWCATIILSGLTTNILAGSEAVVAA
jgi:hypothetical protein